MRRLMVLVRIDVSKHVVIAVGQRTIESEVLDIHLAVGPNGRATACPSIRC